jgi:hypothetical protein
MELSEEDLRRIYGDLEKCIESLHEPSIKKKIKHSYFLSELTMDQYDRLYAIIAAEIRQRIEKVFDKYVDEDLMRKVQEEIMKRKRPRKKKADADGKVQSTTNIGGLVVESLE